MNDYSSFFKDNLTKTDIRAYLNSKQVDQEKFLIASLHTKWFNFILKEIIYGCRNRK